MEKIFSISDLKANKIKSTNCIVIPDWLLDSVLTLCNLDIEYAGQLICYNGIAEYPFISASGEAGSVFPTKKVTFTSPNYSAIEFHTHSAPLGDFWTGRFSGGDLRTFNNRVLQEGNQYQHILFTSKNILTWGKNNAPDVRVGFKGMDTVLDNFKRWNEKYKCWDMPVPPNSK